MRTNQRIIQTAAVQFLYCLHLEGGELPRPSVDSPFWTTLLETDQRKLEQARAKAILFIAQGRTTRLPKLTASSNILLDLLKVTPNSEPIRLQLEALIHQEEQLEELIHELDLSLNKKHSSSTPLAKILDAIYTKNRATRDIRQKIVQLAEEIVPPPPKLKEFLVHNERLARISDRFLVIEAPSTAKDDPAVKHLADNEAQIHAIRTGATELVSGALSQLGDIDALIAQHIDNYLPERLAPVDRAILRLATYQIVCQQHKSPLQVINDSVEIARLLSTSASARFVNGVLDAIYKSAINI